MKEISLAALLVGAAFLIGFSVNTLMSGLFAGKPALAGDLALIALALSSVAGVLK